MKTRAHVLYDGLVQGVFFRANAKKIADAIGVTGWVRNTRDGRVEAVFEGEEEGVRRAVEWCATKQPYAHVDSKQVEYSEFRGEFEDFMIRY